MSYKRAIDKCMVELGLPKSYLDVGTSEEEMFIRLYDIKTFGMGKDVQLQKMFIDNERIHNFIEDVVNDLQVV